jgi:hypothetical protein
MILSTMEVKQSGFSIRKAGLQAAKYLELVDGYSHGEQLQCFVLIGQQYFTVTSSEGFTAARPLMHSIFGGSQDRLTTELCELAIRYWN